MKDDEGWMNYDEGWMKNDEGWWFQAVGGFCRPTNERTFVIVESLSRLKMFSITLKTLFAKKKISPLKTQKYEMSIFSWELSKYSVICNDCPKSSDLYRHKNVTSDGINQIFYALCCIRFDYVSFNLNKNENTIIKNTKIRSHNVKFMWNLLAWCWKSNEGMIQYKAYQQKIKFAQSCKMI